MAFEAVAEPLHGRAGDEHAALQGKLGGLIPQRGSPGGDQSLG